MLTTERSIEQPARRPPPARTGVRISGDRAFFERQAIVGHVERDRRCRTCGHNLRTQPIRRDPRTRLLLCRCPQCGRFHPASASATRAASPSWMRYLARSLMYLWLMIVGAGATGVAVGQGASMLLTLELLTTHSPVPRHIARAPGYHGPAFVYVPKPDFREYQFLTGAAVVFSLAVVFVAAMITSVVFYHWPRWVQVGFWMIEPVAIGFLAGLIWRAAAPELLLWGGRVIALHAGAQMIAGVMGGIIGRPIVRLVARFAVPPQLRGVLAHLWQADNEPVPGDASA